MCLNDADDAKRVIKQLAEQAIMETTTDGFSDSVIRPEGYASGVSEAFCNRFAQLVINYFVVLGR